MDPIDKGIKARPGYRHSVTVPARRVWILLLALPISPAAITFDGRAIVHQAGFPGTHALLKGLVSLVPAGSRATGWVIGVVPEGEFLTCAAGVPLRKVSNLASGWRACRRHKKEDHDDPVAHRGEDRAGGSGAVRGE